MTIATYFARPDSEKILLAIITHAGGTLYLSDRPYITEPTDTPSSQPFEPLIQAGGVPEFRQSLQELTGGRSERSVGALKLVSADDSRRDNRTANRCATPAVPVRRQRAMDSRDRRNVKGPYRRPR